MVRARSKLRDERVPSTQTDEQGAFTLRGGDESANRIAVISPEVLLWVASRKDLDEPTTC